MFRFLLPVVFCVAVLSACSSSGTTASVPKRAAPVAYAMDVTDIDYGSTRSDERYLVSYSFPDEQGRFAIKSTAQTGVSEPVSDTSDYTFVNNDVAASIVCKGEGALQKLNSVPDYLVADRAYQSAYICKL